uniref:Uncharacterized protein n=1 Tax=Anguilla anguilla TaxID=7936 RepID=A0A0E9QN74_ANGAN
MLGSVRVHSPLWLHHPCIVKKIKVSVLQVFLCPSVNTGVIPRFVSFLNAISVLVFWCFYTTKRFPC